MKLTIKLTLRTLGAIVSSILLVMTHSQVCITRDDCMGSMYQDAHGVYRPNPELTLNTKESRCLCSCTGPRTQWGKCINCGHNKDYRRVKKFAQTCCVTATNKKRSLS